MSLQESVALELQDMPAPLATSCAKDMEITLIYIVSNLYCFNPVTRMKC